MSLYRDGINVTTGNIIIGTSGDLTFTDCCKFDADGDDIRIYPDGNGDTIRIGNSGAGNFWEYFYLYASTYVNLVSGGDLSATAVNNLHLYAGSSYGVYMDVNNALETVQKHKMVKYKAISGALYIDLP